MVVAAQGSVVVRPVLPLRRPAGAAPAEPFARLREGGEEGTGSRRGHPVIAVDHDALGAEQVRELLLARDGDDPVGATVGAPLLGGGVTGGLPEVLGLGEAVAAAVVAHRSSDTGPTFDSRWAASW